LPGGEQDPECDRQIEASTLLGELRRSEAYGDASGWKSETGIDERRAHPLLALLDDRRRESHDAKSREAGGETDLDLYQRRLQPELRTAGNARESHGRNATAGSGASAAGHGSAARTSGDSRGGRAAFECGKASFERLEL
jgi:hypothetical protein